MVPGPDELGGRADFPVVEVDTLQSSVDDALAAGAVAPEVIATDPALERRERLEAELQHAQRKLSELGSRVHALEVELRRTRARLSRRVLLLALLGLAYVVFWHGPELLQRGSGQGSTVEQSKTSNRR
jgi:hypothetical protein